MSLCHIVITDDEYYDLYNDDNELACMSGEVVTIVEVGKELVTFRNDNGESSIYFTLTKNELKHAGLNRILEND
ncbi:MAG: hypothetical protein NC401_19730 [Ruminococcus sp.]|nr:hypothetical protein [Ruminococcus sp.]